MSKAHEAYAQTARTGADPRETEAAVLLKAASRFNQVKNNWGEKPPAELEPALLNKRTI